MNRHRKFTRPSGVVTTTRRTHEMTYPSPASDPNIGSKLDAGKIMKEAFIDKKHLNMYTGPSKGYDGFNTKMVKSGTGELIPDMFTVKREKIYRPDSMPRLLAMHDGIDQAKGMNIKIHTVDNAEQCIQPHRYDMIPHGRANVDVDDITVVSTDDINATSNMIVNRTALLPLRKKNTVNESRANIENIPSIVDNTNDIIDARYNAQNNIAIFDRSTKPIQTNHITYQPITNNEIQVDDSTLPVRRIFGNKKHNVATSGINPLSIVTHDVSTKLNRQNDTAYNRQLSFADNMIHRIVPMQDKSQEVVSVRRFGTYSSKQTGSIAHVNPITISSSTQNNIPRTMRTSMQVDSGFNNQIHDIPTHKEEHVILEPRTTRYKNNTAPISTIPISTVENTSSVQKPTISKRNTENKAPISTIPISTMENTSSVQKPTISKRNAENNNAPISTIPISTMEGSSSVQKPTISKRNTENKAIQNIELMRGTDETQSHITRENINQKPNRIVSQNIDPIIDVHSIHNRARTNTSSKDSNVHTLPAILGRDNEIRNSETKANEVRNIDIVHAKHVSIPSFNTDEIIRGSSIARTNAHQNSGIQNNTVPLVTHDEIAKHDSTVRINDQHARASLTRLVSPLTVADNLQHVSRPYHHMQTENHITGTKEPLNILDTDIVSRNTIVGNDSVAHNNIQQVPVYLINDEINREISQSNARKNNTVYDIDPLIVHEPHNIQNIVKLQNMKAQDRFTSLDRVSPLADTPRFTPSRNTFISHRSSLVDVLQQLNPLYDNESNQTYTNDETLRPSLTTGHTLHNNITPADVKIYTDKVEYNEDNDRETAPKMPLVDYYKNLDVGKIDLRTVRDVLSVT